MRFSTRPLPILLTISLTVLATFYLFGCDNTELEQKTAKVAELKTSVDELTEEKDTLSSKLRKQQTENRILSSRISSLDRNLQKEKQRNSGLEEDKEAISRELEKVKSEFGQKRKEAARLKTELDERIGDLLEKIDKQDIGWQEKMATEVSGVKQAMGMEVSNLKQEMDNQRQSFQERLSRQDEEYRKLLAQKDMAITNLEGKLTITIMDNILFGLGSDQLSQDGRKVLTKVGEMINSEKDKEIRVEGHTDNLPFKTSSATPRYTNWELSSARALSVVHFLQEIVGIEGERLAAVGYGEHRPTNANDTKKARAANRRIQLVLVPMQKTSTSQKRPL